MLCVPCKVPGICITPGRKPRCRLFLTPVILRWRQASSMLGARDRWFRAALVVTTYFMIGLLQRVTKASVTVDGEIISSIEQGLMVLVGVERNDTEAQADRLLERLLGYRVFADANDKMNLSLKDVQGGLLLVPQFTLAADTQKARAPVLVLPRCLSRGRGCLIIFCHRRSRVIQRWPAASLAQTCRSR